MCQAARVAHVRRLERWDVDAGAARRGTHRRECHAAGVSPRRELLLGFEEKGTNSFSEEEEEEAANEEEAAGAGEEEATGAGTSSGEEEAAARQAGEQRAARGGGGRAGDDHASGTPVE